MTVAGPDQVEISDLGSQLAMIEDLKGKISDLEDFKKRLEEVVRQRMGNADEGLVNGKVVVTYKWHKETRLVLGTLRSRYPQIVVECSETKPVRTLLIKTNY